MSPLLTPTNRLTADEIKALSIPDPEFQQYLLTNPIPQLGDRSDIASTRQISASATQSTSSSLSPSPTNFTESVIRIPTRTSWISHSRLVRPSPPTLRALLIVLFHGGGFVSGSPTALLPFARTVSTQFNATVLLPSYRLAPEHPFPAAIEDALDILLWISSNAASIPADLRSGFIIGGNSAGANIAACVSRLALDEGIELGITGLWLGYPAFSSDPSKHAPDDIVDNMVPEAAQYAHLWGLSWTQNADAMFVDRNAANALLKHYRPDVFSPLYNPLAVDAAEAPDLSKFPKTYLQVAGADLFRDDGLVLAYVLADVGVSVRLDVFKGVPHVFAFLVPEFEGSKVAVQDGVKGVGWLLGMGE